MLGLTYIRATPTWLRHSDYNLDPPELLWSGMARRYASLGDAKALGLVSQSPSAVSAPLLISGVKRALEARRWQPAAVGIGDAVTHVWSSGLKMRSGLGTPRHDYG
jgi:hypothetical protein